MGKLLSWIVLGALAYLAWRVFVILQRKQEARTRAGAGAAGPRPPADPEAMVRCDRCGVHLPASESIDDGDRHYCSTAHRDGR